MWPGLSEKIAFEQRAGGEGASPANNQRDSKDNCRAIEDGTF